ncbi:MAG TPA: AAA family ATPase [Gammaproteobacteria bacterium]|nr:AAA family ATPase [Gammaproteobacteria bacterium]
MDDIIRACSALNFLNPECPREQWIQIGMAAKSAGLSFDDFHNWSKSAANYEGEKDCRKVWKSFHAGAITSATLFSFARNNGWNDSSNENYLISQKRLMTPHGKYKSENRNAIDIWNRCLPAPSTHEYILQKQGISDGLRCYPHSEPVLTISGKNIANYLVIPCLQEGELQTLQFIPPDKGGKKLNLPGASFNDGYFTVGEIGELIYLCEGIGQAWSVNKVSGCGCVVSFGAGRIKTVAIALRAKYSSARLVIVSDRGKEQMVCDIATGIGCQWIEMPETMPDKSDVNDYALQFGHEELHHLLTLLKSPEMRYKLLSGSDLYNTPPMRWIVQGVLPSEGMAALYGESGSGKSFLILDMAFAVAQGEENWFGLRVTKTPVTYVCLEGESGIGKRIKAWRQYFNKPIPEKLLFVTQPFDLLSGDVTDLANAIVSAGSVGGLVIIDTLNRAVPGADENSSVDMGNIIAAVKKLQGLIGGLVLLVHHSGKDKSKGLRGHSSLYAALDGAIEVIKTDTRREWCVAKSKDDITGNSYPFNLEIIKIGVDDNKQEITSCVVLFDSSNSMLSKRISLSRNQKFALNEIDKQFLNVSDVDKEGAPTLSRCLSFDKAVSVVAEIMPTDAKHRKLRAQEAIAGLVEKKYLAMSGDSLWRI